MKKNDLSPSILKKGDCIGAVLPASPLNKEEIEKIRQMISSTGYRVKFSTNVHDIYGYLAGNDRARAKGFMDLWNDPEVSAIWCARGGFGSGRILKELDYKKINQQPKPFIGMSDITALHLAFHERLSFSTYLGPNLSLLVGESDETKKMKRDAFAFLEKSHSASYNFFSSSTMKPSILNKGVAQGRLIGGNLTVLSSLLATKWVPSFRGSVLLLEDVNEAPYRIDRMLLQLEEAGILDEIAGLILSSFSRCQAPEPSKSLDLSSIFHEYTYNKHYPVVEGFSSGHLPYQLILPYGSSVQLEATDIPMLLWSSF